MHSWDLRDGNRDDAVVLAELHRAAARVGCPHIFPPDSPAPTLDELIAEWQAALDDPT